MLRRSGLQTMPLCLALGLMPACGDDSDSDAGDTEGVGDTEGMGDTEGDPSASTGRDPTSATVPTSPSTDSGPATSGDATAAEESSGGPVLPDECTVDEIELLELTNQYRVKNGLPAIPIAPSLCIVGHTHAEDLALNSPNAMPQCNLHSWSEAGSWSACCYTDDHAAAECMWAKPMELTSYPGVGYENAAGGGGLITPSEALELWKTSPGHNAVILSEGQWADRPWGAMGAGIYEGYAVLWFGEEADPLSP
ncbi:MAG: CAP domain-containing protein [Nannocystaceae bacterium]|nr:CAP domain-containing protein [Nannocystaceae bacterium]